MPEREHPSNNRPIVVIGAGIVGVCCALWLVRKGRRVLLVDGNAPGTVTSCGNACTIAIHGCVPINHPNLPRQLPKLLLGKHRPLRIDPLYAVRHMPWFWSFLKHCRTDAVKKTTAALGQLLAHTYAGLEPLVAMAGCADLLAESGCLYVYKTEREFRADREAMDIRRAHGVRCTELGGGEVRELEPNLKIDFARGVLFEDAQLVHDPQALVDALFHCFRRNGGEWRRQNAEAVRRDGNGGLEVQLAGDSEPVAADKVVIAAGAFSRQITGAGTEGLPLDTERGYHVQFAGRGHLSRRPVHWVGSGFYACPTAGGLRFAGTVEIAGLSTKKSRRTLTHLARTGGRMFDVAGAPAQTWLGYRPTFPDALPVIGPSPHARNNDILFAFGHQHLGLTLAGITGKMIAQLVEGEPTDTDLARFSAARFGAA